MSIPVEAATIMFAPQPAREQKPADNTASEPPNVDSLEKGTYFDFFKKYDPPTFIGNFFEGWPLHDDSHKSSDESDDSSVASTAVEHRDNKNRRSRSVRHDDSDGSDEHLSRPSRQDSLDVGDRINALLHQDDVKEAFAMLQDAVKYVKMTDLEPGHNNTDVAKTYSLILQRLCEPKMIDIINKISSTPESIYDSLQWRLFTKVVEAGYILEDEAYNAIVLFLMDQDHLSLALQALYSMPRQCWRFKTYKLAIALHLLQTPKQVQQAEWLLHDFGKPFIEVKNPLAPTDLPPIRIETPLVKNASDQERFRLWMFYQNALSGTEWDHEKKEYETKRRHTLSQLNQAANAQRTRRGSALLHWAMQRLGIQTDEDRILHEKVDTDNTMIYTAINNDQFEYGWGVYSAMEDAVNEFTPRVVMHLCWRAFSATPLSLVSTQSLWESRAWEVYSRFMCSEFLHPEEPEMPGFLYDLLSIIAFSPEKRRQARYTKTMSVYHLLERLNFDSLLKSEQIIAPILCMLLLECNGPPVTVLAMCQKGFEIGEKSQLQEQKTYPFSICWSLLVLCVKSGQQHTFASVLKALKELCQSGNTLAPLSLLGPIQTFHDRYMQCTHHGDDGGGSADAPKTCYFYDYMFRPIQYTDDKVEDNQTVWMDEWGFVQTHSDGTQETRHTTEGEPIAYIDHALQQRTDIPETHAVRLAVAVSIGAAKGEQHVVRQVYYTPTKAKSLVQHCLQIASR